jgi:hypothetical protein
MASQPAARLGFVLRVAIGPDRPLAGRFNAAMQFHQTGHWCIVQQLPLGNDGNADKPVLEYHAKNVRIGGSTTSAERRFGTDNCKALRMIPVR